MLGKPSTVFIFEDARSPGHTGARVLKSLGCSVVYFFIVLASDLLSYYHLARKVYVFFLQGSLNSLDLACMDPLGLASKYKVKCTRSLGRKTLRYS